MNSDYKSPFKVYRHWDDIYGKWIPVYQMQSYMLGEVNAASYSTEPPNPHYMWTVKRDAYATAADDRERERYYHEMLSWVTPTCPPDAPFKKPKAEAAKSSVPPLDLGDKLLLLGWLAVALAVILLIIF